MAGTSIDSSDKIKNVARGTTSYRSEMQGSTTSSDFEDAEDGDETASETFQFQPLYIRTLSFTYSLGENLIFDVSGSGNYETLTNTLIKSIFKKYFDGNRDKGSRCGILLLFDLTNRTSLKNAISIWLRQIKGGSDVVKNLQHLEHIKSCTMLVGCKLDLEDDRRTRMISEAEHKQVADKNGLQIARISTKNGTGLESIDAFFSSLERIYREKDWAEEEQRRSAAMPLFSCVSCAAVDDTQQAQMKFSNARLNSDSRYNPTHTYIERRRKDEAVCDVM